VFPSIAPKAPKPKTIRRGARTVLKTDWHTIVMLVSSIFSQPVKKDWDAVSRAPAKKVKDAT